MLDQTFGKVYTKFKLHFYKQIFSRFEDREATLTTVESFCMEVIMALESKFDIILPDEAVETFKTVGDLAKYIDNQLR